MNTKSSKNIDSNHARKYLNVVKCASLVEFTHVILLNFNLSSTLHSILMAKEEYEEQLYS